MQKIANVKKMTDVMFLPIFYTFPNISVLGNYFESTVFDLNSKQNLLNLLNCQYFEKSEKHLFLASLLQPKIEPCYF